MCLAPIASTCRRWNGKTCLPIWMRPIRKGAFHLHPMRDRDREHHRVKMARAGEWRAHNPKGQAPASIVLSVVVISALQSWNVSPASVKPPREILHPSRHSSTIRLGRAYVTAGGPSLGTLRDRAAKSDYAKGRYRSVVWCSRWASTARSTASSANRGLRT